MSHNISGATLRHAWDRVRKMWNPNVTTPDLEKELSELRGKIPNPVFWLFGKTQSGKTSLIRYLTGAVDAAIGNGFKACTRFSRMYPFPNAEVPILTFLDTRGVDEPAYDPAEDLTAFDSQAHLILVTCRVADFAHGNVRSALTKIRSANRIRPVILVLTCLHELNPQQQHPQPYPFDVLSAKPGEMPPVIGTVSDDLVRLIREQIKQFEGLVDRVVPVDLTRPEEGYAEANYGGDALKRVLLDSLPSAFRATFARVTEVTTHLKDLHLKHAMPVILAYSSLAATAGAVPVPFVDLLILPAIQAKMVHALALQYGQPLTATRFLEAATTLGMGLLARQAVREVVKFIPIVGSAAGAALAGASTYALGRAFCEYYQAVHQGHVPNPETLKKLYQDQLATAERAWFTAGK